MDKAPVSTVGIVGVSGYSGMELARIVAGHPALALALAVSDKWAGEHARRSSARRRPPAARCVVRPQKRGDGGGVRRARLVFLCTPAEVSMALAPVALEAGARVVDLSGAFRLAGE